MEEIREQPVDHLVVPGFLPSTVPFRTKKIPSKRAVNAAENACIGHRPGAEPLFLGNFGVFGGWGVWGSPGWLGWGSGDDGYVYHFIMIVYIYIWLYNYVCIHDHICILMFMCRCSYISGSNSGEKLEVGATPLGCLLGWHLNLWPFIFSLNFSTKRHFPRFSGKGNSANAELESTVLYLSWSFLESLKVF